MTQLATRRAVGAGRRPTVAVLWIIAIATAAAALVFGYDLWRFLISTFLVGLLIALIVLLIALVPGALGWERK